MHSKGTPRPLSVRQPKTGELPACPSGPKGLEIIAQALAWVGSPLTIGAL
jgi:hypothetical protein